MLLTTLNFELICAYDNGKLDPVPLLEAATGYSNTISKKVGCSQSVFTKSFDIIETGYNHDYQKDFYPAYIKILKELAEELAKSSPIVSFEIDPNWNFPPKGERQQGIEWCNVFCPIMEVPLMATYLGRLEDKKDGSGVISISTFEVTVIYYTLTPPTLSKQ
jgi:hypothetical protein